MLTDAQRRAMRARQLLDSGRDAREVARELGYTKVSGMLGAIALCSRKIERDEKKILQMIEEDPPKVVSKIVTEDGVRAEPVFLNDRTLADLLKEGHADPVGEPGPEGEPGKGVIPMPREEHQKAHFYPRTSPVAHLYPVENGMVTIKKDQISITWKPSVSTVHINVNAYKGPKWLPLYGNLLGGRAGLASVMRQIAEAATQAAALLEEEEHVDHYAR